MEEPNTVEIKKSTVEDKRSEKTKIENTETELVTNNRCSEANENNAVSVVKSNDSKSKKKKNVHKKEVSESKDQILPSDNHDLKDVQPQEDNIQLGLSTISCNKLPVKISEYTKGKNSKKDEHAYSKLKTDNIESKEQILSISIHISTTQNLCVPSKTDGTVPLKQTPDNEKETNKHQLKKSAAEEVYLLTDEFSSNIRSALDILKTIIVEKALSIKTSRTLPKITDDKDNFSKEQIKITNKTNRNSRRK
ncbi:uncharacterized protein LOC142322681 [Lycorma delicatula]|uniref:uncharacterized protein LOC142322681 n=1 Tax=Lycorma delicatula TaxID=130591 RepID=UPI003F512018